MSLLCKIIGHKWNGCKCSRCGETRDDQHDWDLCKGICKYCNKTQAEQHDWDLCKGVCRRCGVKQAEQHDWRRGECWRCGKLTDDQAELAEIVISRRFDDMVTVIQKLTIHSELMRAAMNTKILGFPVNEMLIDKIKNQSSLEEIARNACCIGMRQQATKRLTNQLLLFELCYDKVWQVCNRASETLTDQTLLIDIYNDKTNSQDVRRNAVKNIKIQSFIADIIKNETDEAVRATAVEILMDQSVLIEVARHDRFQINRIRAIKKLTDKSVLEEIKKNYDYARLDEIAAASGRLHDMNKK